MKTRMQDIVVAMLAGVTLATAVPAQADTQSQPKISSRKPTTGNNFTFVRFYVRDLAKSTAFYTEALGLQEVRRHSPPKVPALEIFLGSDNPNASLIDLNEINDKNRQYIVGGGASAGSAVFCIEVTDVAATIKKAVELGGKVVMPGGPVKWPEGSFTWALIDDPDGNHVELLKNE